MDFHMLTYHDGLCVLLTHGHVITVVQGIQTKGRNVRSYVNYI